MAVHEIPQAWKDHDASVMPYVREHRVLGQLRLALGLGLLALGFRAHFFNGLETDLSRHFSGFALYIAYFGVITGLWGLCSFGFSIAHYRVERRFGVSRQTPRSWLLDQVKGLALGAALGLIVLLFTWWAVTSLGAWWWV
ncbi:hypothetical protein K2X33_03190, partial [bacterium]|nr:hypothetical protein [bacterium]